MRMQQNAHVKEQHMHIKAYSFKGVVFLLCFIHYVFLRLWFRFDVKFSYNCVATVAEIRLQLLNCNRFHLEVHATVNSELNH